MTHDRQVSSLVQTLLDRKGRDHVKRRVFSFFLDWSIWGYVAYTVMYFLNHYWFTRIQAHWYDTLTLPAWGWPVTILATFELAVLCRHAGRSLGCRAFGLAIQGSDGQRASGRSRWLRWLAWHPSLLLAGIGFWTNARSPWHDRVAGTAVARIGKPGVTEEEQQKKKTWTGPSKRALTTQWGAMSVFLLGLTLWVGWLVIRGNLAVLVQRAGRAGSILEQIAAPNFRFLFVEDPTFAARVGYHSIVELVLITLLMTFLATVLGTALAVPLSFVGARNLMSPGAGKVVIYTITRGFFNIFRAIETLLWATIFAVWIGWGRPLAGVLALTIHTIAALGKLFSEQVESIDPGPLEAIRASGGNLLQVIRYGVIPQVTPSFWAFTLYRWDINVRMATIIAMVGAGGIGTLLFFYKNYGSWSDVGAVVVSIVVVVWVMDYLSGWLREKVIR